MTRIVAAKAWLGGAGLVLGLVGIALQIRTLVWAAAAFLTVAFLLRLLKSPGAQREQ